jgi:hypothetical protein
MFAMLNFGDPLTELGCLPNHPTQADCSSLLQFLISAEMSVWFVEDALNCVFGSLKLFETAHGWHYCCIYPKWKFSIVQNTWRNILVYL